MTLRYSYNLIHWTAYNKEKIDAIGLHAQSFSLRVIVYQSGYIGAISLLL